MLQGAGHPGHPVKVPKTAMRHAEGYVCKSRDGGDHRKTPEPAGAMDGGPLQVSKEMWSS